MENAVTNKNQIECKINSKNKKKKQKRKTKKEKKIICENVLDDVIHNVAVPLLKLNTN